MAKRKVSATLSPDRLDQALELTGTTNVSEILDLALDALVERELERRWLAGHRLDATSDDLPVDPPVVDLSDVPWDEAE